MANEKITSIKKSLVMWLALLLTTHLAQAQSLVKGTVKDEDQLPLIGVSVQVKGTFTGTVTDNDGQFTVEAGKNDVLIFTYVGYERLEVAVNNQTEFNIILKVESEQLQEVIVTALGVKKEVKRMGYAAQEVKGSELVKAREPNPVSNLVGKVSGLSVGISPEMLGSPRLNLRGSNISLYVVDGIPINSDTWNINPDDIESITVLKGPAASALYGYRGQNGAIVITTKKGSTDKRGFSIEINSSTMVESGFVAIPKVQDEYGPGDHGRYSFVDGRGGGTNDGDYDVWGPKFEGQLIPQYDSPIDPVTGARTATPWVARGKDNLKRFLQPGLLTTQNVAVSSTTDKADIRFSTSYTHQKGLVPNTKLNAFNFNTSLGYNFSPRLRFETNINYNRQTTPNFPDVQYGPNSMVYNIVIWGGADWDVDDMRNYWQPGKEGIQQIYAEYQRYNNPWFLAKEWLRGHYKNDIYGYATLKYKLAKNLELLGRTNVTTYDIFRPERFPYSATSYGREEARGDYREDRRALFENNTEVMLKFDDEILKNVNLNAFVGGNLRSFRYNSSYTTTNYLNVPGIYSFANSRNPIISNSFNSEMVVRSGYYSADLTYKSYLTLSHTGRVDKLSTLPPGSNTYYYPTLSASTVISDYVKLPTLISFLKLRGSMAVVKSGGLSTTSTIGATHNASYPLSYGSYYYSSYEGPTYGLAQVYSTPLVYNNSPAAYYTNNLFDPELRPNSRTGYEGGLDLRFIQNRLGLDLTYFTYINGPLIFNKPLSQTTGYTGYTTNAIKTKNRGVELTLSASPIKSANQGFNWNIALNWSTYKETYLELPPGQTIFNQFFKVGDRVDKFYAQAFVRTQDGQIINDGGGRPLRYNIAQFLGHGNPDWIWGINNKFTFKGLFANFAFDGRQGGVIENYIRRQTFRGGRHIETVQGALGEARYQDYKGARTYLGEGVQIATGTPKYDPVTGLITNYNELTFKPNETKTFAQDYVSRYYSTVEGNLMKKTYAKLREVTIGYTVPQKWMKGLFVKSADIAFVARNVGYWMPDNRHKDIDLDQYVFGETGSRLETPTTKRYGINLNITF